MSNPKEAFGIAKASLSTVPANVLMELGVAMTEGASKYGRHNYRASGIKASVYYDALMRHSMAWWEGQDIDPDSGINHITKAIATLVVLRDSMMHKTLIDDRPPKTKAFMNTLNKLASKIRVKHKDKQPTHYAHTGQFHTD